MNTEVSLPVKFIVAVSGGVDSVVLLHILSERLPQDRLVVAHFDHGIRPDSADDALFVQRLARIYGLTFIGGEGRLGASASEAAARQARYQFLRSAKQQYGADFIVTAHHEDDVLETVLINLMRGTGRKGLSSLSSTGDLYRPLLKTPKQHMYVYARKHRLQWREDSTNQDQSYLRNYIRLSIMPNLTDVQRQQLKALVWSTQRTNQELDQVLQGLLQEHTKPTDGGSELDRQWFKALPDDVAREIIAAWLRSNGIAGFDRKAISRLSEGIASLPSGKQLDVQGPYVVKLSRDGAELRER